VTSNSGAFVATPVATGAAAAPTAANSGEFIEQPVGANAAAPSAGASPSGPFGFLATAPRSANLLGDMWGLRPILAKYGMTLSVTETSEVLGNVSGGQSRGFEYDGLTTAVLQLDTQRAFGLYGGLFDVSALQIHGRSLSADNLLTMQTASGIEADRATRLWELWYQQKMFDDKVDIKIGQQSLDQEFMGSQNDTISSTPCLVGPCCLRPICPAAGRPTRFRPWGCAPGCM
jgi:porin